MEQATITPKWHYFVGFLIFGPFIAPILAGQKKVGTIGWLVTAPASVALMFHAFDGRDDAPVIIGLLTFYVWIVMVGVMSFWLGDYLARRKQRGGITVAGRAEGG